MCIRAEAVAAEVLSRTPGRPSLSGVSEKSPSLTIRLPKQERARLDRLAAEQGRRTSQVVRAPAWATVWSTMAISHSPPTGTAARESATGPPRPPPCLLYTSDAADDLTRV